MKRKSGFTLVEMLVVVVIIGILSAALIPRLTGYMARTRDLKRHADLRNIAAAITMYKDDHGVIPFAQKGRVIYTGSGLGSLLSGYLSSFPNDPLKQQHFPHNNLRLVFDRYPDLKNIKGEYLYWKMYKSNIQKQVAAVLLAKVETLGFANYIYLGKDSDQSGGSLWMHLDYRYREKGLTIDDIYLCDTITSRVSKGQEEVATVANKKCTYSSEDQLYYIVKIE